MRTQVVKTMIAGFTVLTLASCAFNGDSTTDQTKNYLNDRNKILSTYQPVLGSYDGEVAAYVRSKEDVNKFELKTIKIRLDVYTQDIQGGKDANGQSTPMPALIVRYRQLDIVRPDELLDARFVPESGQLYATNQSSTNNSSNSGNNGTSNGGFTSICSTGGTVVTTLNNAHFDGKTISGTILRGNGELGKFTATRTNNPTISPANDPITDCNDRLAVEYQAITGTYKGKLTQTPEAGGEIVDVGMVLSAVPMTGATGSPVTSLVAAFRYSTYTNFAMSAVYRADMTPPQLSMSYLTNANAGGGFQMTGTLDGDTFVGEAYSGNVGHLGHVVLKKATSQASAQK